jgi:hypothetical protein
MAEEVPEYDLMKPGHRFDTGPLLLDLYRLLTMVLGDKHLAEMEEESFTIQTLRGQYVFPARPRAVRPSVRAGATSRQRAA